LNRMESDWMMIYSTPDEAKAHLLKALLEREEIPVVLMNKAGYPYNNLGEVEIYVFWQQAERAIEIVYNATA